MMILNQQKLIFFLYGLLLIAGLLLLSPLTAWGYFSNQGVDSASDFSAGTLDVAINFNKSALSITATSGDTLNFSALAGGSLAGQYQVTAVPVTCTASFWSGLETTLSKSGNVYAGALSGMSATSSTAGTWALAISASSSLSVAHQETCSFNIMITSWQNEFAAYTLGGFSDTENFLVTVTFDSNAPTALPTSNVVLNEVYPNPDTASGSPLNIEWIELYNGTGNSVDVAGFKLGELAGATENLHTIVADCTSYPASSHMQPYGTNNTVINPGGRLVVEFCGSASYLNDGGDTVTFYDISSTLLETYTYTPVNQGKSNAKIPDGGTWVDPIPTPGAENTATAAELLAEGWSQTEIDAVLGTSTKETTQDPATEFTFATSVKSKPVTATATATATATSSTSTISVAVTAAATTSATSSGLATSSVSIREAAPVESIVATSATTSTAKQTADRANDKPKDPAKEKPESELKEEGERESDNTVTAQKVEIKKEDKEESVSEPVGATTAKQEELPEESSPESDNINLNDHDK